MEVHASSFPTILFIDVRNYDGAEILRQALSRKGLHIFLLPVLLLLLNHCAQTSAISGRVYITAASKKNLQGMRFMKKEEFKGQLNMRQRYPAFVQALDDGPLLELSHVIFLSILFFFLPFVSWVTVNSSVKMFLQ